MQRWSEREIKFYKRGNYGTIERWNDCLYTLSHLRLSAESARKEKCRDIKISEERQAKRDEKTEIHDRKLFIKGKNSLRQFFATLA